MKKELFDEASRMRKFLEQHNTLVAESGYLPFSCFPEGCCEYASFFLAYALVERSVVDPSSIKFPYNTCHSDLTGHGWLRIDETWDVDITADQFGSDYGKIIVSDAADGHLGHYHGEWETYEVLKFRCTWFDEGEGFSKFVDTLNNFA